MAYKEELEHPLKATPLVEGSGSVEAYGSKLKHPGVLVEVLRYRQRLMGVYHRSVDKVEYRFRLAL